MSPSGRLCTSPNKVVRRGYQGYCAINIDDQKLRAGASKSDNGIKTRENKCKVVSI